MSSQVRTDDGTGAGGKRPIFDVTLKVPEEG